MVNQLGKRFVNESISYKLLGKAAFEQPERDNLSNMGSDRNG